MVRQSRRRGQRGHQVLQPRAERVAAAGQRARRQPADAQRLSDQRGQDDRCARPAPRRPRRPRLQHQHDRGCHRRRERLVQPGADPAARHPAQGQHDLREPARDARRPRRAGGGLQAGDQGPRALLEPAAPARAGGTSDGRRPQHARAPQGPRQRPHRPARPGAGARARRQAVLRALDHGAAEAHAGDQVRAPLHARPRRAGCATSARGRPTTTPTATSPASSRSSTPTRSTTTRPAARSRRSRPASASPGCRPARYGAARARPPSRRSTARRPSATPTAPWTATRASCSPAHEARPRHRRRPRWPPLR